MRLTAVHANRHIFDGLAADRPIRLLLQFGEHHALRIGVAGDGYGAILDGLPLDPPFDMADYGQVDVADVSDLVGAYLRGAEVTSLHALTLDGHDIGVRLGFDANVTLNIWVDGDELHWGDPEALAAYDWPGGGVPVAGFPIVI